MEINVKGTPHELTFTYKAVKAITKFLGCSKIADLETALNNIGYDNAAKIASVALKANGVEATAAEIEESIEDAAFPVTLLTAIAKAIAPEQEVTADVVEGN
jgi:fumarate hydratase class II